MHAKILTLALALWLVAPGFAGLREPDAVVWGRVIINRAAMTAADSDVVIEARRSLAGAPIASYRLGGTAAAGDLYSLRLVVESGLPLSDPAAVLSGDSVYIVVTKSGADRDSKTMTIAGRGSLTKLDFGSLDANGNGLLDDWESQYFPGVVNVVPSADFDGDGASNLREFQEGTNPLLMDARHPADRAPNDGRISINEVTSYGLAWRNNLNWPVGPSPVEIAYVTKAGALWKGGEVYRLDTNLAITAPLWWTNSPLASVDTSTNKPAKVSAVASEFSRTLALAATGFLVHLEVVPSAAVSAFAVEESLPAGWTATEISDGGGLSQPQNTIRWGLFLDGSRRALSYRLVPLGVVARQAIQFSGVASFDGANMTAGGLVSLADPTGALSLEISGRAAITIRGVPGQIVALEISPNLHDWAPFKDVAIGANGSVEISAAGAGAVEFFRASTR